MSIETLGGAESRRDCHDLDGDVFMHDSRGKIISKENWSHFGETDCPWEKLEPGRILFVHFPKQSEVF